MYSWIWLSTHIPTPAPGSYHTKTPSSHKFAFLLSLLGDLSLVSGISLPANKAQTDHCCTTLLIQ